MNALTRSILSLSMLAATSTAIAHEPPHIPAASDDGNERMAVQDAYFARSLLASQTRWQSISAQLGMTPQTGSRNATGNGGLQLCPNHGGSGYSHGYDGETKSLECSETTHSFSLNNSGDADGTHGFEAATARVTGYADGRLVLKGDGGITLMGETTFQAAAYMSGHQLHALGAATADNDAVNLSQLKAIVSELGGGATFNQDGGFTKPTYDLANGGKQHTIGEVFDALDEAILQNTIAANRLDSRVSDNKDDILDIYKHLEANGNGIVKQDLNSGKILVGGDLAGSVVDFSGKDGPRVLSGIGNGKKDDDAVTLAQLKALGAYDPVNGRILGALVYDDETLDRATLGGSNGTVVANIAGGLIAQGSKEAINGGQFFDLQTMLQNSIDDLGKRIDSIEEIPLRNGDPGDNFIGNDAGGERITHIADGIKPTDAASVGQVDEALKTAKSYTDTKFKDLSGALDSFKSEVHRQFERIEGRLSRLGAMSAAQTQMAINASGATTQRGRIAAGVGLQNGKSALAIGYASRINERVSLSIGGAFSGSENNAGMGIGVDF
ncbi:MAG TPA: YadA-like family protein [Dyella sp.]|uniref:YadA-like family protein n=1 Tax=Dyella sp. TaxID=1869338 RepID=UPI002F93FD00